jgi:hydroxymethylbilane synthase
VQTAAIRIGTRGSALALWQAGAVRDALVAAHAIAPTAIEIVPIRTTGDRITDRALLEAGGKGLFTKEIEEALLDGSIDLAVHSAKDMQTFLPEGLTIGAYLEREDVRDALVSNGANRISQLPEGAHIGTASIRREALLRRVRPDLKISLLRGNVPTRLGKIESGEFDATLLAAAGLRRLGLEDRISAYLDLELFPPACGQGAVAIECREGDRRIGELLAGIDHRETRLAVTCERAFLGVLDGSCRTPIAGLGRLDGDRLVFKGVLLSPDGGRGYEAGLSRELTTEAEASALGREAGLMVRGEAPDKFLAALGIA